MSQPLPRVVVALALGLLAVRLALAAHLELAFDEAYYWTWAKHPALSYYDHPPMVAWFIRAGIAVAGDTELGVRLLGPFSVFFSTLLLMGATRDFGGDARAMTFAGLFSELTIAAQALGVLMTPDTPLLLFSALTLRLLAALSAGGRSSLWLAVGLAAGAALLSKYTAVFIGLGILVWLLAAPARRRWLATIWPWAGGLVAAAVFSPVLVWNAGNGWMSFAKQGGRTAVPFEPSLATVADFLGSQMGLLTPVIAVSLVWGLSRMAREAVASRTDRAVLLSALAVPILAYLALYSIGSDVEGNWTLVALPPGLVAAALATAEAWDRRLVRRAAVGGATLAAVLSAALLFYLVVPGDHGLGRRDITHRLSGHAAVAAAVTRAAQAEAIGTVVAFDYTTAALLGFYAPGLHVIQVTDRQRYVGWVVPPDAGQAIRSGKVLAVASPDQLPTVQALFADSADVGEVQRLHRGTTVDRFVLLRAGGFLGTL